MRKLTQGEINAKAARAYSENGCDGLRALAKEFDLTPRQRIRVWSYLQPKDGGKLPDC